MASLRAFCCTSATHTFTSRKSGEFIDLLVGQFQSAWARGTNQWRAAGLCLEALAAAVRAGAFDEWRR
jgi:hypothetical protein